MSNNKKNRTYNANHYHNGNSSQETQESYINVTPEIISDNNQYYQNNNQNFNDNYFGNYNPENNNFVPYGNNADNPYQDFNANPFANQYDSQFTNFSGFQDNSYQSENINNDESHEMLEFMLMQELLKTMSYEEAEQKVASVFNKQESTFYTNNSELMPVKQTIDNELSATRILSSNRDKFKYTTAGNTLHIKNNLNIIYSGDIDDNEIEGLEIREDIKPIRTPAVKSMLMSQNYVPPLTINTEVDMTEILNQQKKLKSMVSGTKERFSTISFVVKAISIALEHYPKLNSFYDPDTNELVIKKSHHIGIATETSDGLVIPVIKYVEQLSLKQLSENINSMNHKLREGTLHDYDILGSTITIVNYGAIGAVQAVPTIYYPNSSVIGVGRIVRKPVVLKGDKLVIRSIMNLTVTVDQRIIDSAEAGIFLSKLQEILEAPDLIVLS